MTWDQRESPGERADNIGPHLGEEWGQEAGEEEIKEENDRVTSLAQRLLTKEAELIPICPSILSLKDMVFKPAR